MRIGLDATPLIEPAGGIPRYVTELALALARLSPRDEIHLLSDQRQLLPDRRLLCVENIVAGPPGGPSFAGKWWSLGLPWELKRRRIDVFHGTNFEVPYLPLTPAVVTVHDLSPWKQSSWRPPGSDRVRRRAPIAVRLARTVITPTEAIRREAIRRFRLAESSVVAIPHGPSPGLAQPDREFLVKLRSNGLRDPFLLYAGARSNRKNIACLAAAWRQARQSVPGLQLVLAGPGGRPEDEREDGLFDAGVVSDGALAALLSETAAFVYPSIYEGFGLPILEAMRAGAPVIASRDPALVEVAGGAALHVDNSVATLAKAVVELVGDARRRDDLRRLGLQRAARFSWRFTAERTRQAYERAIRRGRANALPLP